jgi:hypothetical protein
MKYGIVLSNHIIHTVIPLLTIHQIQSVPDIYQGLCGAGLQVAGAAGLGSHCAGG